MQIPKVAWRLLILAAVLVYSEPQQVDARAWRKRCMIASACVHPAPVCQCRPNCIPGNICPMFVWLSYGSYCSYYAVDFCTCDGLNYDSTDCLIPPPTGCDPTGNTTASQDGCNYTRFLPGNDDKSATPRTRPDDPGVNGYGYGKTQPILDQLPSGSLPGAEMRYLTITDQISKVFKFNGPHGTPLYGQVVAARVKPKFPRHYYQTTFTIVSRGFNINNVPNVDWDLTVPTPGNPTIAPAPGLKHEYILTMTDPTLGLLQIPVVTHYSIDPNAP